MSFTAFGMGLQAATPQAGFALQNATPNILTWTAPNDGQNHRAIIAGEVHVTLASTGGSINVTAQAPDSGGISTSLDGGTHAAGTFAYAFKFLIVAPGSTVTVVQSAALTAGAATAWAEIWGS